MSPLEIIPRGAKPQIHWLDFAASDKVIFQGVKVIEVDKLLYCDAACLVRAMKLRGKTSQYTKYLDKESKLTLSKEEYPDFFTEDEHRDNRFQEKVFLTEDGMYDMIVKSRTPEGKAFKKWLLQEVIPSIRRYGKYDPHGNKELAPPRKTVMEIKEDEVSQSAKLLESSAVVFSVLKKVAGEMLLPENQAILRASEGTYRETGVDFRKLLGFPKLISQHQDTMLNVTELFQPFKVSPKYGNIILCILGLQTRTPDHRGKKWLYFLTEKGKQYGVHHDVPRVERSDSTTTYQIRWRSALRSDIEKYLQGKSQQDIVLVSDEYLEDEMKRGVTLIKGKRGDKK